MDDDGWWLVEDNGRWWVGGGGGVDDVDGRLLNRNMPWQWRVKLVSTRPVLAGWVFRPRPDPTRSCSLCAQIQPDPTRRGGSRIQKKRVLIRPAPVGALVCPQPGEVSRVGADVMGLQEVFQLGSRLPTPRCQYQELEVRGVSI